MNEVSIRRELCTYYVIMSKDRKYIISGKGYSLTLVPVNRSWRPRMFRTRERALQLFTRDYHWYWCWAKDFEVPMLEGSQSYTKAEVAAYFKDLLDNYFDIVKVCMTEQYPTDSKPEEEK